MVAGDLQVCVRPVLAALAIFSLKAMINIKTNQIIIYCDLVHLLRPTEQKQGTLMGPNPSNPFNTPQPPIYH